MKKTILATLLLLLFPFVSFAAVPPYDFFCEDNGYELSYEADYVFCVFDDGEKCDVYDFYDGECGEEYKTDPATWECKDEGSYYFAHGDQCCEGLTPFLKPGYSGQPSCKDLNIFEKFWWWLVDLFK